MADAPVERYKVWPTHEDQPTFAAVMDSGSLKGLGRPRPGCAEQTQHGARRLSQAYAFFWFRIEDLLTRP